MGFYSDISPNSLYMKVILIGGLVIVYQLDLYERWIVHIRSVLGGSKFDDLFYEVVGKADEGWIDNHFEDEGFEDWEKFV